MDKLIRVLAALESLGGGPGAERSDFLAGFDIVFRWWSFSWYYVESAGRVACSTFLTFRFIRYPWIGDCHHLSLLIVGSCQKSTAGWCFFSLGFATCFHFRFVSSCRLLTASSCPIGQLLSPLNPDRKREKTRHHHGHHCLNCWWFISSHHISSHVDTIVIASFYKFRNHPQGGNNNVAMILL